MWGLVSLRSDIEEVLDQTDSQATHGDKTVLDVGMSILPGYTIPVLRITFLSQLGCGSGQWYATLRFVRAREDPC